MSDVQRKYSTVNAPTLERFHASNEFVRGIMGPIGSGKSTACVIECLTRAQEQKPSPNGKRKTRIAIIRNSYPELKTTTLKTWLDWVPLEYGKLTMSAPIRHHVVTDTLDMEVYFLALDREEDVKKLLSLELTYAWMNEAREIPKPILDTLTGRVGRYPSKIDGGATWHGVMMDTNPPDDQSWWYKLAEETRPEKFRFFRQPSGLSKEAENVPNLPDGYYSNLCLGKDQEWVNVYVHGNYGYLIEGKPVFPNFRDSVHVAKAAIQPRKGVPILIGVDFGLTPAAVFGQKLYDGRWIIFDEYVADNTGVVRFAKELATYIAQNYAGFPIAGGFGDPAGSSRGYHEETAFELMNEYCALDEDDERIQWQPAPSNDLLYRLEGVKLALDRLVDGKVGFLVSPKCKTIRKGFNGGYHFKFIRSGDGTQTQEYPNKNRFSHPMDALQYLVLGGGEHQVVARKVKRDNFKFDPAKVPIADGVDYDFFS